MVHGLSHWCKMGKVSVMRFDWFGLRNQTFRGLLGGFKRPIPTPEDLVQALRGILLCWMIALWCCRFFGIGILQQCRPEPFIGSTLSNRPGKMASVCSYSTFQTTCHSTFTHSRTSYYPPTVLPTSSYLSPRGIAFRLSYF